jgi:hypothetical protein
VSIDWVCEGRCSDDIDDEVKASIRSIDRSIDAKAKAKEPKPKPKPKPKPQTPQKSMTVSGTNGLGQVAHGTSSDSPKKARTKKRWSFESNRNDSKRIEVSASLPWVNQCMKRSAQPIDP